MRSLCLSAAKVLSSTSDDFLDESKVMRLAFIAIGNSGQMSSISLSRLTGISGV
jgi:hypothetical protein